MPLLSSRHFPHLTFPDEVVLASTLNLEAQRFVIAVSGVYLADGRRLIGVRLDISDWSALTVKRGMVRGFRRRG